MRRIEEASLNAWPALRQSLYDGWLLRFSRGYTKRANSVNPLYDSALDPDRKIAFCEVCYREQGLPPLFRITPFATPPDLDQRLERRGYRTIDPTLVLTLALRSQPRRAPQTFDCLEGAADWLPLYCRLSGAPLEDHQTHHAMLDAINAARALAYLTDEAGECVTCGLGVLEDRTFGLFDLVTDPTRRNRGYGTALIEGLLAWAEARGAQSAYLQVMANNAAARHVYEDKLGFERLYEYWYRVRD